jgi:hypothetical protein
VITYFENNASRVDYPRYRTEGLPMTSAYRESFVKEINYRVKGTDKFWNDGNSAEAILQLRAAELNRQRNKAINLCHSTLARAWLQNKCDNHLSSEPYTEVGKKPDLIKSRASKH